MYRAPLTRIFPTALGRLTTRFRAFCKDQEGSSSLETIIWMPVFALVLAVVTNISLVFFQESQMLRVAHDANRAFSLGRMSGPGDAETYVKAKLAYLGTELQVASNYNNGYITTRIQVPAVELMPLAFMRSSFSNMTITVSSSQIVEF
jgi:Flp pilus assembly protein TadG